MTISRTLRLLSLSAQPALALGYNNNNPVRWGILSAGRIASDYVKAMKTTEGATATAVAARSATKAATFASTHSIPTSHGSYTDLLSNPNVDVIYIGTIADHHAEWARESILAGKPTVVEKPMTLTYDTTKELIELARDQNVFLMEGMWTRCFPAMHKLRELIASEVVGPIIYSQMDFGWEFPTNSLDDRIWLPDSGGVTLDVGMYVAQLGQVAFPGAKLKDVKATGTVMNGVDYSVSATVTYDRNHRSESSFGDGMLQLTLTGAANTEERCVLQGTKGRIIIDGPFHVPQRLRVLHDQGRGDESNEVVYDYPLPEDPYSGEEWNNPGSIGFVHQINEVGKALREGKKECESFTWEDSLEVARIVDEIVYQVRGERDVLTRHRRDGGDWLEEQAGSS
ncbi:hypothetical protein ACHAXR_011303 [Thalassiosira sp. AJA248-18]